jgi:hypothetical protein
LYTFVLRAEIPTTFGPKCGLVLPLLKKFGLDFMFENFRPISNLPFVAKSAEKATISQLQYLYIVLQIPLFPSINQRTGKITQQKQLY